MFKNGTGLLSVFDRDYGVERAFQLYDEREVLSILEQESLELIEVGTPDKLGGIMYFTDSKLTDHCVFFTRKVA